MSEESKLVEPATEDVHSDAEEVAEDVAEPTQTGTSKKKRKNKNKGKKTAISDDVVELAAPGEAGEGSKLSAGMVQQILKSNPSLATEAQGMDPKKIQEMMGKLKLEELLTGMV